MLKGRKVFIISLLVGLSSVSIYFDSMAKISSRYAVNLLPGQNQSFMLTNQFASFYFGQTSGQNLTLAEGLNVETEEFLEDYSIQIDGEFLNRQYARTQLGIDKILRHYYDWNLTEEVCLLPRENIVMIKLKRSIKTTISIYPAIPLKNDSSEFITHWDVKEKTLFVARKNHLMRTREEDYPIWLGITTLPEPLFVPDENNVRPEQLSSVSPVYLPGRMTFKMDSVAVVLFLVGDYREEMQQARKRIEGKYQFLIEQRGFKLDRLWPRTFQKSEQPGLKKRKTEFCHKNIH